MFDETLRLFVIADDPLVRAGLAAVLAEQPGCMVIGQAESGVETAVLLGSYRPDIIIWDVGWTTEPDLAWLADRPAEMPPLLALLAEDDSVPELWAAGVRGLLWRETGGEPLAAACFALNQGMAVLDPAMIEHLLPDPDLFHSPPIEDRLTEALTPREHEVLQLLAEGLTNKAIAHQLAISEHTVKFHVTAIMSKLNAQSRTEAVVRATRLGLFTL